MFRIISGRSAGRNSCKGRSHLVTGAAASVVCEVLECRRLLSTYTYTVPSGHTAAYLQGTYEPGRVVVRLDSPGGAVGHEFLNLDGKDIIVANYSGFLFVDQVPAASKPTADGNGDSGIEVQTLFNADATLRIEAGDDDTLIMLTDSTSSGGTVTVTDNESHAATTSYTAGVTNLILRTNDVQATDYYSNSGDGTFVWVPALATQMSLTIDTGDATYAEVQLGGGQNRSVVGAVVHTGAGNDRVTVSAWDRYDADGVVTATVDFDPGIGSGLGNSLIVGDGGTATLEKFSGSPSHTITLSQVYVIDEGDGYAEAGILHVADASSIEELNVNATSSYSFTPAAFIEAAADIGTLNAYGQVYFAGTGAPWRAESLYISGGYVACDAVWGTLRVDSLTIDSGGVLDLSKNYLIVDWTGESNPYDTIWGYIGTAYNGGNWTGRGITTSEGDSSVKALGAMDNTFPATPYSEFGGQSVDASCVLVRLTLYGDANVDGTVNYSDLLKLSQNYNQSGKRWYHGDSTYDGVVNYPDMLLLSQNYNESIEDFDRMERSSSSAAERMAQLLADATGVLGKDAMEDLLAIVANWQ